jgi:hypothetical protein
MSDTSLFETKSISGHQHRLAAHRLGSYVALVLAVGLAAGIYSLRQYGVFACQAGGYLSDRYLAYCQATSYGDYDHGAFWFGLEPSATAAAASAQVLFLGDSRMQFAFSTPAIAKWFSSISVRYYLMGFSHSGNYMFEQPLLRRIGPQPKVYVVNVDRFFDEMETAPAKDVMWNPSAHERYRQKRMWQPVHRAICTTLPIACRDQVAFFRMPSTGAWSVSGGHLTGAPVSYDSTIDRALVERYTASGYRFLSSLAVPTECVLLTVVPTKTSRIGTAKALAAALDFTLVAPELSHLNTFDESHLDAPSAERWSAAFIDIAGPQIQQCINLPHDSR